MQRLLPIIILAILAAAGCSSPQRDEPRPDRPGQQPEVHTPAQVRITPTAIDIDVDAAPASGSFTLTVERSGSWLPDTAYALTTADLQGALSSPPSLLFAQGATTASAEVRYTVRLTPGQSSQASIGIAGSDAACRVTFRYPSDWQPGPSGRYTSGSVTLAVESRQRFFDGGVQYRLTCPAVPGFERLIRRLDSGVVRVESGPAGIEGLSNVTESQAVATEFLKSTLPLYTVESAYHSDGSYFGLSLTYTGPEGSLPRYDVLRLDGEQPAQWEPLPPATLTDGWLVGVVSYQLEMPPLPSECPWPVEAWRSREDEGIYRLTGIYRVASPLSKINSCPELRPVDIVLDPLSGTAEIRRCQPGFTNSDLFDAPFEIGGTGTFITGADGSITVTLPRPLHSGHGAYPSTWATVHPSVIVLPAAAPN